MNARRSLSAYSIGPARRGFTLIELLTVIAIIGVLAAIIIPTVGKVRDNGRLAKSTSNVRQLSLACGLYAAQNKGQYPSDYSLTGTATPSQWWMDMKTGVWAMVAGSPSTFSGSPTRQQRAGTAFESPNLEDDGNVSAFENKPAISYSMNRYISSQVNRRYGMLYDPARTILIADASSSNEFGPLNTGGYLGAANWINARNGASSQGARDGKAVVAYVDGHIALLDGATARTISITAPTATAPTPLAWR